ncbi:HTH-type transcriptional regulator, GntR family [Phaeobacter inhibens]|uniref:HTH-type transcriptional regulator, GntR family n=2 Tax=Roseobacteraceae TaxID=2854170 RepID=A0A2I7KEM5_9RHOB|nr:HTH-type transcriptional regulator, GntR family [Phaeobacter inhibens]AUQ56236.1 HTH-type transcriptional regulator, GntR family [Phaeobacter inhibens]AUQ60423.1 HTH-type transcriptional regulator, GntR family [Phaeobacter inhibens]AUQ64530.1 HTH-type transcriptional regulator, GntR family [Phaeobacter inhibens]AUQ68255.1 HTH-type transcriptional regulator, GntR family [Phaeobacter inhibens]
MLRGRIMSVSATISDRIYHALSERIVTGALPAGEKLRQDHIAREFNASHVPVREALLRLEAHGLAQSIPRRGMRVTALDPSEIREVIEMRVSLELLALQNAFAHLGSAELEAADAARLACDAATDMADWEQKNRAFHRVILSPCGMPRLLATIDDLHIASARHLFANWKHRWSQRVDTDHALIVQAMRRRDVTTACDILRRHLRRVR